MMAGTGYMNEAGVVWEPGLSAIDTRPALALPCIVLHPVSRRLESKT